MDRTITLSRSTVFRLVDAISYPNPDDSGPIGPGGPVIRSPFREIDWVLLNPQPLPPKIATALLKERLGPQPEPWRVGVMTRSVIASMLSEIPSAGEHALRGVRTQLSDLVDDWCGTHPPRSPWPWPPRPRRDSLFGEELIVAGAQFGRMADTMSGHPLQEDFAAAAGQLFEAGLKQLESTSERELSV
jgi:hypothetical protein